MNDKLLDLYALCIFLGRSVETIKKDMKRNQLAVPPQVRIPGTRLLRWQPTVVDGWIAEHVELRDGGEK